MTPSPMGMGHAQMAVYLAGRANRDGLDVVRLSPGFVYGPGGLFKLVFVDQARQNRLRCIGRGANWWSCVHVDDLATAFADSAAIGSDGSRLRGRRRRAAAAPGPDRSDDRRARPTSGRDLRHRP